MTSSSEVLFVDDSPPVLRHNDVIAKLEARMENGSRPPKRMSYFAIAFMIVKISLVALELYYFSISRHRFIKYLRENRASLEVLFTKDYPTLKSENIPDFVSASYSTYKELSAISLARVKTFQRDGFFVCLPTNQTKWQHSCQSINSQKDIDGMVNYIIAHSITGYKVYLKMRIFSIFLDRDSQSWNPKCYINEHDISILDNVDGHSFRLSSTSDYTLVKCDEHDFRPHKESTYHSSTTNRTRAICSIVLAICLSSMILSFHTFHGDITTLRKVLQVFRTRGNMSLSLQEKIWFINGWTIGSLLSNLFIIIGTFIWLLGNVHIRLVSDVCSIFLGVGVILSFCVFIRVLNSDRNYHTILDTLKKGLPEVFRYLTCVCIVFVGFMVCGWVTLGPYHPKYATAETTAQTLFATLNGDDIYITFQLLANANTPIFAFGQVYIYVSVFFFMYFAVSMLISIITLSYKLQSTQQSCPSTLIEKVETLKRLGNQVDPER